MTRNETSAPADSRKRRRSGSSAPAAKRRRASAASSPDGERFDKATRLAIDHMIHDDISHPLYRRNIDQVTEAVATAAVERGEGTAFPPSLEAALSVMNGGTASDEANARKAERLLLQSWTRTAMQELAAGLASAKYSRLREAGGNWKFEDVSDRYRMELKITPLIDLDDDEEEEEAAAAPLANKRSSSASGKATSKPRSKAGAALGAAPRQDSAKFPTPQDTGDSGSGDEEDSSEDGDDAEGDEYSGDSDESDGSEASGSGSDSD